MNTVLKLIFKTIIDEYDFQSTWISKMTSLMIILKKIYFYYFYLNYFDIKLLFCVLLIGFIGTSYFLALPFSHLLIIYGKR